MILQSLPSRTRPRPCIRTRVEAGSPDLTRWVIPTMANSPGREGACYRTKVILSSFDSDLNLAIRLYGPGGAIIRLSRLCLDQDRAKDGGIEPSAW